MDYIPGDNLTIHSRPLSRMAKSVNPDLVKERQGASFDVERLTNLLDGSITKTRRRRYLGNPDLSFFLFFMFLLHINGHLPALL